MKKKWFIASYKTKELTRLEYNLKNQKFDYYIPKIITKKINSSPREEPLFPGYIFVNTSSENYSALKYTMGIKKIIKFGDNIAYMSDEEIEATHMVEERSKLDPVPQQIQVGQSGIIVKGALKGILVKICSLPHKERVRVFLTFLGTTRRVTVPINDLKF